MKPKTVNLIQLNIAVLLWGLTAQFAKGIDLPTWQIICFRSLISAIALAPFLKLTGGSLGVRRPRHYLLMLILGGLLCGHWLTYFQSIRLSSAAVAILALHTYPVITALVEPFIFREKLKKIDVLVAAVVFTGVLIMTPALSLDNEITRAIVIGVASGQLFMIRNLIIRKYVQEYSGSELMYWQVLVAGAMLLPVFLLNSGPAAETATYTPRAFWLLALLGVVFTALPQTLYAAALKHLSAKTVGVLATLLPFYGAFWGYVIHHEQIALRTALGGGLILACIVFETTRSVRSK